MQSYFLTLFLCANYSKIKQTAKKAHKHTREYYYRKILLLFSIIIYTHFHLERDSFAVAQLTFRKQTFANEKWLYSENWCYSCFGTTKISTQNTEQKYVNY